ncbi:hypothetical protein LWI28_010536 [Acer negundo]|uniref:Uncharacterized protein n=1 Tax=Acer negundo TaxID=4023 RepID=A0AAD5JJW0_ACENE|nr:hypothetical protein LWI28_010536 [Acer negundo]KAK4855090.1 hypothetical protein QYF36_003897 [Acer negundo]
MAKLAMKELTYLELEDLVFEDINVDKTLYDLKISSVVSAENGRLKYHIRRDRDVRFLLHIGGTHCSEIYVDLVDKVRRDVREDHPLPQGTSQIPTRVLFEPSHSSSYVASTGINQASESVPTTHNVAPTVEVSIWNGDYGISYSFIGEQ